MFTSILIAILSLLALLLIYAAATNKPYSISAEIIINKSNTEIFNFIKHLKNQEKYSKWIMADPKVQLKYTGNDGIVGFIAAWKSDLKNVGIGEQELIQLIEGKRYDVEIRFEKPFKGVSTAFTTTDAISESATKVTTTFHTKTPWPMNLMIPMITKMLKKDMDENNANLKRILENN